MFFKIDKIIIILFRILLLIELSHTLIDPIIPMCIDGEVSTAVTTRDGSTYIFMNFWFWKLNDRLDRVVDNGSVIADKWQHLSSNIETSFYVSGDTNRLNGKTFFIKNDKWYQYDNQVFEETGNTGNWTELRTGLKWLALSQYDDPIILFIQKNSRWTDSVVAYFFDSPYFPDKKQLIDKNLPFSVWQTEAFISYPNGKYLLFMDDQRVGAHCIMTNPKSDCVNYRLNSELFECPDYTKKLFEKNYFIKFWYWSGLGLKQFAIIILGLLISLCFILLFLLFIFSLNLKKLIKKKCRKS